MRARSIRIVVVASGVLGCGPHGGSSDGSDTSSTSGGESSGAVDSSGSSTTGEDHGDRMPLVVNRDAAILFVIDDGATMAAAQARLALAAAALAEPFVRVDANLRVGFTTTDNGNPTCDEATLDGGALVLSSCQSRLADFTADMQNAEAQACTSICSLAALDVLPSATGRDPEPKPRPWLETGVASNLPDALEFADAFACAAPQGIAGCGFPSLLESMYLGLQRSDAADDAAYGFVEDAAVLGIVMVSNATDCSNDPAWSSIFLPADEGGDPTVFWSDPMASAPTPAVCWNAGVVCTGGPAVYDECHAVDKDVAGNGGASADDAVLYPLARYVDAVQAIEDAKQVVVPDQQVIVAAIAGVPPGYEAGGVSIPWAPAEDPLQETEYGIGPGCMDALGGIAVPPVREREVTEALAVAGEPAVFSVCAADYSSALAEIAERMVAQLSVACASQCVADTDPGPIGVQPSCTVVQEVPGMDDLEIPPCNGNELPNGETVCWIARVDKQADTKREWDDMSQRCIDEGWNLEIDIHRSAPLPAGGVITFACEPSPNALVDCPDLP